MYIEDELTEQEKNELAIECGYSEERYTDNSIEGVSESFDKNKELSIDRKTLKRLIELWPTDITGDPVIAKFLQYDAKVEQITAEAKEKLGI